MLPTERHRFILETLEREISVRVGRLQNELRVTPMTLWRDLRLLEDRGLLKRVRGGAVRMDVEREPGFASKVSVARAAKTRIARYAADHWVEPGAVVILEGGTTVAELAGRLKTPNLTVLTNSLPVLNRLQTATVRPAIQACGGLYRPESGTFVGREALSFFGRRRASVFFMSATALSRESGITDPNPQEIEVKQAMAHAAQKIVLLADATKFGEVSLMEVLPWRRIDVLVTDAPGSAAAPYLPSDFTRRVTV